MIQLQNNFTTPEQTKSLLELGLPADSADCYIGRDNKRHIINGDIPKSLIYGQGCLPCWSAGRLIEIAHICSDSTLSYEEEADKLKKFKEEHKCETIIEAVIMCIADAASICSIDFSKLED